MKIVFLGYLDSPLIDFINQTDEIVAVTDDRVSASFLAELTPDMIVSYGYRYILGREILDLFQQKIINLHISYLPWNRGADPNFWSHLENTPKGVTIHYIDNGIDTGAILAQRECVFSPEDTLKTSYEKLQSEMRDLFKEKWMLIRSNGLSPFRSSENGTYHRRADRLKYAFLTERLGFDTPIFHIQEYGKKFLKTQADGHK